MRNWDPYISDVVEEDAADGMTQMRAICLAPQNSRTSVGLYRRALMAAATGIEVDFVAGWAEIRCWHRPLQRSCGRRGQRHAQKRTAGAGTIYGAQRSLQDDHDRRSFHRGRKAGNSNAGYT